ncbi:TIGR02611 family protein [Streptomyces sp. Z26]|nr:TIGR02611 family protein [Streptomyces sp. Z26]
MDVETDTKDEERPLGSRAPRFVRASRPLHLSWQVGVFLVGLAIVVTGVILLPLPGPGWLIIFGGMAVWATEFVWAQLCLRWTKRKVGEGTAWWKRRRLERAARKQS